MVVLVEWFLELVVHVVHEVLLPGVGCLLHGCHGPRRRAFQWSGQSSASTRRWGQEKKHLWSWMVGGSVCGTVEEDWGVEEGCGCGGTDWDWSVWRCWIWVLAWVASCWFNRRFCCLRSSIWAWDWACCCWTDCQDVEGLRLPWRSTSTDQLAREDWSKYEIGQTGAWHRARKTGRAKKFKLKSYIQVCLQNFVIRLKGPLTSDSQPSLRLK